MCYTCTVYNPATDALPGTHFCRHCGVLYRVECRFAHQLRCHSRPGTSHSEPFDVGNRDHRFALLAVVSRLTHSKINVALRAHNKQHPSKRLRDIALREEIGGLQRIAHPDSPVAAELAIMAQGYPLPVVDASVPVSAQHQAWLRDPRNPILVASSAAMSAPIGVALHAFTHVATALGPALHAVNAALAP